jgi:1-acyl-sn-glycerol-3-phosphate acyltransferase
MTTSVNIDAIMNQPGRVRALRRVVETVADGLGPLGDLYRRPYVDGLQNLPRDGRFLLVGNHTQFGAEVLLIPYVVRRAIGPRVRPLADRGIGLMRGPAGDLFAAYGAVVGAPETASELMRHNETILVFPGGGREMPKFKGEEYTLRWQGRSGFARLSVQHDYSIVPVGLVGGDDVYQSLTTRGGRWGQLIQGLTEKLAGRTDMAFPLVHGVGPTPIPRPQRMYLRFAAPIDTTKPARVSAEKWVTTIKQSTEESLQQALADLLTIRSNDPHPRAEPTGLGHCDPVTDRALTPGTLSAGDTIRPATSCAARPTRTATAIRARHCTNTPTSRGLRNLALISDEGHGLIALPRIFRPHESALRAAAQRYARPV